MLRSFFAVTAGFAATVVWTILVDLMMLFLKSSTQSAAGVRRLAIFGLVMAVIYGGTGAWVCLRIARRRPWMHIMVLVAVGETLLIASLIGFWGRQPLWYGLGLLAVFPASVLLGGRAVLARAMHDETDVLAGCGK